MNIETFRIFKDVVDLHSFCEAAEKNYISQSAVSQQITHLETSLNCELIRRKKRPFKLTTAGQKFYVTANDILDKYDKLKSEINTLKNKSLNVLNVGAVFCLGMHSLQPYIKKFMEIYPDIHLNIQYMNSLSVYESVDKGTLDLGIVAVPIRERHLDVYRFKPDRLMLVCNPDHVFASSAMLDVKKLDNAPFVAFSKDMPTRQLIEDFLKRYDVNIQVVLEFDNIETIKRAVEIGAGVSILPESTVRNEISNNTLKTLSFSNQSFFRPAGIIKRKDKILSVAGKTLVELLHERV